MTKIAQKIIIDILLPKELGDTIISFRLMKILISNNFRINILLATKIQIDVFGFFFDPDNITLNNDSSNQILIDYRCPEDIVSYQDKIDQYKISIGYHDHIYRYSQQLILPKEFTKQCATEIYLQSLKFLKINNYQLANINFHKWVYSGQKIISLIPGTGHKNRSFEISNFELIYNQLQSKGYNVNFIFGPQEKLWFDKFKLKNYICRYSKSITETYNIINKSQYVIVNEGGSMHLLGAIGIPFTSIYKSSSPINWHPYNKLVGKYIDLQILKSDELENNMFNSVMKQIIENIEENEKRNSLLRVN